MPTSLASVTLMAVVNPSPKVLLLMQAFLLPFSIKMADRTQSVNRGVMDVRIVLCSREHCRQS